VVIFSGPVVVSFGIAFALSRMLPRADNPWAAALWIAVVATGSLLTLVVFERAARRLIPLAALLNLSLVFPDRAPKRFAVARRTGTPAELRARLQAARDSGHVDEAQRLGVIVELVLALSVHDRASRGHSERVRVFADLLAIELKLTPEDRERLRWSALLHDIGKLEVPASILNKPVRLSETDWTAVHRHPEEGARIVAPLLPWLGEWGAAIEQHHERVDGTGYPRGLRGNEISRAARIVAVADTWEVMTAPRPYKRQLGIAEARRELVRVSGTQLDPEFVRAFLNISIGKVWRTIGIGAWIGQIPTLGRLVSGLGNWAGTGAAAIAATAVIAGGGAGAPPATPSSGPVVLAAPAATPSSQPDPPAAGRPAPTHTPALGGTATPVPASSPTPGLTPPPTSAPTTQPAPSPSPSPASPCPLCTNTSPKCTSYCSSPSAPKCTTYCLSNNNSACTSYCYGNNNPNCLQHCEGANNPKCQVDCSSVLVAEYLAELRSEGLRLAGVWRVAADEAPVVTREHGHLLA